MFRFALGCAVFLISTLSYAQTLEARSAVKVRSGPATSYSVRASIWLDDQLKVTGKSELIGDALCSTDGNWDNDLWLQVDMQGVEGWVNYCLVRFDGDLDNLPIVEPVYPESHVWINMATVPLEGFFFSRITDKLGETPNRPYVLASTRTQNFIHLRAQPGLGADILDHLSSKQVYVIGASDDAAWVQIEYDARLSSCLVEAESVDDCLPERLTGWVARYLLFLPQGWQDTFVDDAS